MNDATPAQNRTLAASGAESGLPTDQGAREALVERLAEAMLSGIRHYMGLPDADVVWNFSLVKAAGIQAKEIAPLVAAQVEAAVSVVRAEVELLRIAEARERDLRHISEDAYRALREGLAALATYLGPNGSVTANAITQILAPSPAEGTGEACDGCGSDGGFGIGAGHRCTCNRRAGHGLDETDNWHGCECGALWECPECFNADMSGCAQCGAMPEAAAPAPVSSGEAVCCGDHDEDGGRPCNGCPDPSPAATTGEYPRPAHDRLAAAGADLVEVSPVSSGEACCMAGTPLAGPGVTHEVGCTAPAPVSSDKARDPASPCRCHPADDDSGHCGGWMPPAPVVTPGAEGSEVP